jgi:AraC family transcriptional regulator
MPERVLGDHELVWMLQGRARLTGEVVLELEAGDVLLIPPGLRHAITWLGGSGRTSTRHGYVHFAAGPRLGRQPRLVRATRDDPLAGLGAYLLWLGSAPAPDDGAIRRTVEFMLEMLLDLPKPHLGAGEGLPLAVVHALGWWRNAWAESPLGPVPTSSMAAAAHVSVAQLNRLFGRATGSTPAAAVSRLRCARAEDLLANTDLPFAAVARLCGYADAAHFSHRFRTLHGVSPRAYRAHGLTESVLDEPGIRRISHLVWHE